MLSLPIGSVSVALLAFNLPGLAGIDPAAATLRTRYADPNPDPVTLARLREELGLDEPALLRFGRFLGSAVRGDFGLSFSTRLPVGKTAWDAFAVSAQLVLATVALSAIIGLLLGVVGGGTSGRLSHAISTICAIGAALPAHTVGPLTTLLFGVWLRLLPTGGWGSFREGLLPIAVLAIGPTVTIAEVVRTEMVAAMKQPFIRTAVSKGLSTRGIWRHGFAVSRHGLLAIVGVMTAGLLSGAVLVETLFSVPGLGRYLVDATRAGDVPALQCGLLMAAVFSLLVGTGIEFVAQLADPRQRRRAR